PPIAAVEAPDAMLVLIGLAGAEAAAPLLDDAVVIVGMDHPAPSELIRALDRPEVLGGLTQIFQRAGADIDEFAAGIGGPSMPRHALDDHAGLGLVLAQEAGGLIEVDEPADPERGGQIDRQPEAAPLPYNGVPSDRDDEKADRKPKDRSRDQAEPP